MLENWKEKSLESFACQELTKLKCFLKTRIKGSVLHRCTSLGNRRDEALEICKKSTNHSNIRVGAAAADADGRRPWQGPAHYRRRIVLMNVIEFTVAAVCVWNIPLCRFFVQTKWSTTSCKVPLPCRRNGLQLALDSFLPKAMSWTFPVWKLKLSQLLRMRRNSCPLWAMWVHRWLPEEVVSCYTYSIECHIRGLHLKNPAMNCIHLLIILLGYRLAWWNQCHLYRPLQNPYLLYFAVRYRPKRTWKPIWYSLDFVLRKHRQCYRQLGEKRHRHAKDPELS